MGPKIWLYNFIITLDLKVGQNYIKYLKDITVNFLDFNINELNLKT